MLGVPDRSFVLPRERVVKGRCGGVVLAGGLPHTQHFPYSFGWDERMSVEASIVVVAPVVAWCFRSSGRAS
jgi:hypothetical protein